MLIAKRIKNSILALKKAGYVDTLILTGIITAQQI